FLYHRIKILNEAGRQYADVTIELPSKTRLEDLQARTIHPDGTVIQYRDAPFEKTVVKGRGIKFVAQSFSFPEVTLGSIVEYKYKPHNALYRPLWIVEHNLFTVKESFDLKYSGPYELVPVLSSGMTKEPTRNKGSVALQMENIPAFQPEPQMPPEVNYKLNVIFVPNAKNFDSSEIWNYYLRSVSIGYANFLDSNHHEVNKAA